MVYGRDGTVRTFADGFFFCNGIAFEPDGTVVVVERRGPATRARRRHAASG